MNNEKLRQQVHQGIDRHCATLSSDPYRVQRVLHMAHEEGEQMVKRKPSLGLVLVLILALTGTVALLQRFCGRTMCRR